MLGRTSQYNLKVKLPSLKKDFVANEKQANFFKKPKANQEDQTLKMKEFKHLPQVDRSQIEKVKVENAKPVVEKDVKDSAKSEIREEKMIERKEETKPQMEKQKSGDFKGTNTLTYSETNKHDCTNGDSGNGKQSENNTLFKFTEKPSKCNDEEIAEEENLDDEISHVVTETKNDYYQEALTKSQNFEWPPERPAGSNITRSNFLDSRISAKKESKVSDLKPQDESEILDEEDIAELYRKKAELVPEFRAVWFQFNTDAIYCSISSLAIIKKGKEYGLPFGIAKIVLKSQRSLDQFLNTCHISAEGKLDYDYIVLEDIKNSESGDDVDFENDMVTVKGEKIEIE